MMKMKVDCSLKENDYIRADARMVQNRPDDSPDILRLEITNELSRDISIHTGLPFPISGTRAVDAPVPAHLVPTSSHIEERHLKGPSKPYHIEEIDGEKCWVREEGYGGVDVLAAHGIHEKETERYDFAFVVDPDAEECFPPGDYVFEAELGVSLPPDHEIQEWLTWRTTVQIA